MYHPRMSAFKDTFKKMFDEVDHYIEEKYGHLYPLHPVRPARGETSNPAADGLFNIGADFTTGYGSKYGRGYLIDISMSTLEKVPEEVKQEISQAVVAKLEELLPIYFPNRKLEILSEGSHFKICGDFSLGYS